MWTACVVVLDKETRTFKTSFTECAYSAGLAAVKSLWRCVGHDDPKVYESDDDKSDDEKKKCPFAHLSIFKYPKQIAWFIGLSKSVGITYPSIDERVDNDPHSILNNERFKSTVDHLSDNKQKNELNAKINHCLHKWGLCSASEVVLTSLTRSCVPQRVCVAHASVELFNWDTGDYDRNGDEYVGVGSRPHRAIAAALFELVYRHACVQNRVFKTADEICKWLDKEEPDICRWTGELLIFNDCDCIDPIKEKVTPLILKMSTFIKDENLKHDFHIYIRVNEKSDFM